MAYSDYELSEIFDSTGGHCYYCRTRLAWNNYGDYGARGAWEVDHYFSRSRGGGNGTNNLVPACIPCNRRKGDSSGFLGGFSRY